MSDWIERAADAIARERSNLKFSGRGSDQEFRDLCAAIIKSFYERAVCEKLNGLTRYMLPFDEWQALKINEISNALGLENDGSGFRPNGTP